MCSAGGEIEGEQVGRREVNGCGHTPDLKCRQILGRNVELFSGKSKLGIISHMFYNFLKKIRYFDSL